MGKVRLQRYREDRDGDESSLKVNVSVSGASTSAFNVFRANSNKRIINSLRRAGPGLQSNGGGKKRARRSDFATNQVSAIDEETSLKRLRVDNRFVAVNSGGDAAAFDAALGASTPLLSLLGTGGGSKAASGVSSRSRSHSSSDNAGRTVRRQNANNGGRQKPQQKQQLDAGDSSEGSAADDDEEHSDTDYDRVSDGGGSGRTQLLHPHLNRETADEQVDRRVGRRDPATGGIGDDSTSDHDDDNDVCNEDDLRRRMNSLLSKASTQGHEAAQDLQDQESSGDDEEDIVSRSSENSHGIGNNADGRSVASRQLHLASGGSAGGDGVGTAGDRLPSGVRLFLHRGSALVALSDLAVISFAGSAWLQVARGSVRVFGIRLRPCDGPVHLQSVPGSCLLVTNTGPDGSRDYSSQSLHDRMQLMGAGVAFAKAQELISRFPRKTIVVMHGLGEGDRYSSLKPNFRTASDSTPENMWSDCRFYVAPADHCWVSNNSIGSSSSKRLDELITTVIKAASRTTVRLAVVGSRNSGKSTMMRVLCNRILHSASGNSERQQLRGDGGASLSSSSSLKKPVPIFVLDLDPGQTEFTPAACVSLVEVSCLLMGPPGTHQMKPRKSLLLGDSTPGARPESYVAAVNSLISYVNNELTFNHILIVNTMGWLIGIGDLLLGTVLDIVKPCKVIATSDGVELPMMAWPAKEVQIDVPIMRLKPLEGLFTRDPYTKPVNASEHRRATIISYFGGLSLLNRKTIALPWNSVALHEVSGLCPPQELLRLMNANVVALCSAAEDTIWKSKADPTLPMLLREASGAGYEPIECLGFAFVRAVDMVRKTIHLITPETEEIVRSANALVHCTGLNLTEYLVTNQNRGGRQGPAPYSTGDNTARLIREL